MGPQRSRCTNTTKPNCNSVKTTARFYRKVAPAPPHLILPCPDLRRGSDNFYSAGFLNQYLLEFFVLLIHPVPGVYFTLDIPETFGYVRYSSDELLTVLMLPRVYLLWRVIRDELKLCHESIAYRG